ncbi:CASP-like protein 1 [Rutidosis leptorrhynchoides]|uniref:CASP-like protein 1 n=1 Tax=Rutidosis leptorrhynchoides TaxID=125765 RepID=UPI003A995227
MASNDTATPPHSSLSMEVPLKTSAPPPPEYESRGRSFKKHAVADSFFRVSVFVTSLVALIVMVTDGETKRIPIAPGFAITRDAKWNYSPAYIYFISVQSVAILYSIITGVVSILSLMKPGGSFTKLKFHLVILDALLLGLMASATGAAAGVGYIGLKGNSHSNYNKICNRYHSYCIQNGVSTALSLASSVTLLLLVWLSAHVLSKKIARQ